MAYLLVLTRLLVVTLCFM